MIEYEKVYKILGLPDTITSCAIGRIKAPLYGWVTPSVWYGFPPALIPILSNGSGPNYLGYWKHWFTNREPTYIKMYIDSGRKVTEIARTSAQFFCYIAMQSITEEEGISPALQRFASLVGISNLPDLDAVSLKSGDNPAGFSSLYQFAQDAPLSTVNEDQYDGSFPTGRFNEPKKWWENSCSFEVSNEAIMSWPSDVSFPIWMLPGSKVRIFDQMLEKGDFHDAWLTLNSTGWSIEEAKAAIMKLSMAVNDSAFAVLASAWCAVADPSIGNY